MKQLTLVLLLASAASAQVTRTEAQSVLVDVLVTDKKGSYISGLSAKDFQVWEDGKEQMVDGLFTEKGSSSSVKQSLLLLFDNAAMTSSEQNFARQIAMQILDQAAAAGDPNVAVLDFGGSLRISQTFTSDVTRAKQTLARPSGSALSADGGAPRAVVVEDLLKSLEGLMGNLQGASGRKSLVFFSPGYTVGLTEQLKRIIGAANQSNVSFYPVNVRSTAFNGPTADISTPPAPATRGGRAGIGAPTNGRPNMGDIPAADPLQAGTALLGVLMDLAERTGGFVVRNADDRAALTKISQEQSEFYVLSYTPPDSPSGSCHKIRVKVKRDGMELRSREGYCKRTPGDLLSGTAASRTLEQRALAAPNGNISATMQAPFFYKAPNVARVAAVIEILPANVAFKKEKDKFRGQLDILGIANKEDGSAGARFSDIVKFEFDSQAQVDQFKRTPYRYENQFDIASGEYKLAVALGGGGESFAKLQTELEIEPYTGDFALSGLALSREARAANQTDGGLDEFLIDDRKKLIAEGVEIIAAATSKLSLAGPVGAFFEIYEPLLKSDPELVIAFQIRVLDRASGEVRADTGLLRLDLAGKRGSTVLPLGLNLPVKGLAPGNYVLEVQAVDSANKTAKRSAPFELE